MSNLAEALLRNMVLGGAVAGTGIGGVAALTAMGGAALTKGAPGMMAAYYEHKQHVFIRENVKALLIAMGRGSARGLRQHKFMTMGLLVFVSVMLLLPVFYMWHDMLTTPKPTGWTKFFYMFTDDTDSRLERQLDLAMITTAQMVGAILALWLMYIMLVCGMGKACKDPHAPRAADTPDDEDSASDQDSASDASSDGSVAVGAPWFGQ